jgi:hypothetical protein
MPSKLFTYALSGKPLLASLRDTAPPYELFKREPKLGHVVAFGGSKAAGVEPEIAVEQFLREVAERRSFDRRDLIRSNLASSMAHRHAELFETWLAEE